MHETRRGFTSPSQSHQPSTYLGQHTTLLRAVPERRYSWRFGGSSSYTYEPLHAIPCPQRPSTLLSRISEPCSYCLSDQRPQVTIQLLLASLDCSSGASTRLPLCRAIKCSFAQHNLIVNCISRLIDHQQPTSQRTPSRTTRYPKRLTVTCK